MKFLRCSGDVPGLSEIVTCAGSAQAVTKNVSFGAGNLIVKGAGAGTASLSYVNSALSSSFQLQAQSTNAWILTASSSHVSSTTTNAYFSDGSSGGANCRAITQSDISGGVGVTSVGLSDSTGLFAIAGSPVTTSGTITLAAQSQTKNTFYAAPNGSNGSATFRTMVTADLPATTHYGTTAYLSADQSITSTTTLTTVTDGTHPFSFSIGANEVHKVEIVCPFTNNLDTTGLQWGFTMPTGCRAVMRTVQYPTNASVINSQVTTDGLDTSTSPASRSWDGATVAGSAIDLYVTATIINSSTAGSIAFVFAQNASSATALKAKRGATMVAVRVA